MDYGLITLIIAVLGFCATTIFAFIKISNTFRNEVKASREEAKKELENIVREFRDENRLQKKEADDAMDKTVKLLFKRFDDHKDAIDKRFVYQVEVNDNRYAHLNMCEQTKQFFGDMFKEIKDSLIRLEDRIAKNG